MKLNTRQAKSESIARVYENISQRCDEGITLGEVALNLGQRADILAEDAHGSLHPFQTNTEIMQ